MVWINGKLVDKNDAKISVFDHGTLYGDGVFEGIRIYGGRVFQFPAHMDRLFVSAERIYLQPPYTKQELIDATYETMRANGVSDGYIRMVVTRGEGTLGLDPFQCFAPCTFIIVGQIAMYSDEMYENGMAVIIAKTTRTPAGCLDPRVKSLNYLNNICAKIECVKASLCEAIMLNDKGNVSEATGDNVFIVKDGVVITPPAEAGILLGITRNAVMHLCKRMDIPLKERDFKPVELYAADECFLTGTAAEVIAVTKVDDRTIGDGKVGPVTGKLLAAFRELTRTDEEIPYQA